MQNAVWKFSAVAGVLAVCLLAVLQVQESLRSSNLKELTDTDKNISVPDDKTPDGQPSEKDLVPPPPELTPNELETVSAENINPEPVPELTPVTEKPDLTPVPEPEQVTAQNNKLTVETENEIVGLDLNQDLSSEDLESESLTFDEQPEPELAEPQSDTNVVSADNNVEADLDINGIELTSNETFEPEEETSGTEDTGPQLFAQAPTDKNNEPEPLTLDLTENAEPLEENSSPEEVFSPEEELKEEPELVELPSLDEVDETPEVKKDPFADSEPLPLEDLPEDNKQEEEIEELLPVPDPDLELNEDTENRPFPEEAPEKDEYDQDLLLDEEMKLKEDESPDLAPIPDNSFNLEEEKPEPENRSREPKPLQLITGEDTELEKETPELDQNFPVTDQSEKLTSNPEKGKGIQKPHLKIEKVAPKNAVLGKPLIYSILIKNAGDKTAHKIVVEDQIPRGTKLTGTIPQAEWIKNRLIWNFKELKPGEQQKIAIRVIPEEPGTIGSVATVRFATEIVAETLVSAPGISLDVKLQENAQVGQEVVLNFTVNNKGKVPAKNVIIRNILPKMFNHADGEDLEYEVGDMAPGETKDVALKITASHTGEGFNQAIVTADGGISAESKSPISVTGQRLKLVRTGPKFNSTGNEIIFANKVQNHSDKVIKGAKVVEEIPQGVEFKGATRDGRYDPQKRIVSWEINSIDPDETQDFKVKVVAHETGVKSSRVALIDTNGTKSIARSQTSITNSENKKSGFSSLNVKLTSFDAPLKVGETVAVKVRVQNRGTAGASQVKLNLHVPKELELLDSRSPLELKQVNQQMYQIQIPAIQAEKSFEVELALKVLQTGDVRIASEIHSAEMNRPLIREEPLTIISE